MQPLRLVVPIVLLLSVIAAPLAVLAQQARVYRIGIVLLGGPYTAAVDGLRDGLKELGWEEGRQFILHVRDVKGDPKSVETAARSLESEKVDLIYSVATSVTVAVKRATESVPIVCYAGNDPVAAGLVKSFAKPGGRVTGIYSRSTLLLAKRLELLKEMIPNLRRVVYFYNPGNPIAENSAKVAREAARQLKVQLDERPVRSVDELRAGLEALRPAPADALTYIDGLVISQTAMIIDTARTKKLATMVGERASVAQGALASYGVSYHTNGELAAKQVQRILLGADPGDIPVEQVDRFHLAINLKTAKALGLSIPQSVVLRADELID
jgi:putative ABC transport system substrate-binding protein